LGLPEFQQAINYDGPFLLTKISNKHIATVLKLVPVSFFARFRTKGILMSFCRLNYFKCSLKKKSDEFENVEEKLKCRYVACGLK